MKRVVLHIDRLVLRGFRPENRAAIVEGLRGELGRLLADPTTSARLSSTPQVPKIDAGRVSVRQGGEASQIGAALGGAVVRGIKR